MQLFHDALVSFAERRVIQMKVSVVMATYNGEKYIREQLDSLREQTRPADEVLIFDDGSTDKTVEIVKNYIIENNLSVWNIHSNEENLGWKKNFMYGFQKAKGEIIFASDQDDIWNSMKIEKMLQIIEERTDIDVLACSVSPFQEDDGSRINLKNRQYERFGNERLEKVPLDSLWMEPVRPGCAMCFRKKILKNVFAVWYGECAHDLAIWAYGIACGSAYVLNDVLLNQRRHLGVSTPSNAKRRSVRSGLMRGYVKLASNIFNNAEKFGLDDSTLLKMQRQIKFYEKRKKAIENRDIITLISLVGEIKKYRTPKGWVADCISAFR